MNKRTAITVALAAGSAASALALSLLAACGGGGGGDDDGDGDGGGGGGGGGGTGVADVRVLAANDLGMHCMDREFSVFSILPPFNVLRAQALRRETAGAPSLLGDADVDLTYEPVADASGSVNSRSIGKTDFWAHATALFGATLAPGQGLTGLYMPLDAPTPGPQRISFDGAHGLFSAAGIPITPTDDNGRTNTYPLLRVTAREKGTGRALGHVDVVVPVAQETDCSNCHVTGAIAARGSLASWSSTTDRERQTKENVLLLHDAREGTHLLSAQPVLCASCHYSPALDLAGTGPAGAQVGHATFSSAMHAWHGSRTDATGAPVFPPNGDALSTCYQCHPGAITRCARGAMVNGGLECLQCHGDMRAVGGVDPLRVGGSLDGAADGRSRRPWKDLPRCQSCHTGDAATHLVGTGYALAADGIRLRRAFLAGDPSASPISAPASRFAENASTLYRFSKGHGGVSCEHCHGSTHAEWPVASVASNDNVAAISLQGHAGFLMECAACHLPGTLPLTTAGPHGMHNVNDPRWTDGGHGRFYENNASSCRACHGVTLDGTALSRAAADRVLSGDDVTVRVPKGTPIGCAHCHEKPR